MSPADAVARLTREGVRFWREADRVHFRAPAGVMSKEDRRFLRAHRAEVLALLAQSSHRFALSGAQESLWFLQSLQSDPAALNFPQVFRIRGPLDRSALQRSFQEIVRRHDALRAAFPIVDGEPVQVVHSVVPTILSLQNLESLPFSERDRQARELVDREIRRPFSISDGPLFRIGLIRLRAEEHLLVVVFHHLVFDGGSVDILLRELSLLYGAFLAGRESPLAALPSQVPRLAEWQKRDLDDAEGVADALAYWRGQWAEAPAPFELTIRGLPAVDEPRGRRHRFRFPYVLVRDLRRFCREENATLYMVLLSAFGALLQRYTREDRILIGAPQAGRYQREAELLIGCFVDIFPLCLDLTGDITGRELLGRVREMVLGCHRHSQVPFSTLLREAGLGRRSGGTSFFDGVFSLTAPRRELCLEGVEAAYERVDADLSVFGFATMMVDEGVGISGQIAYREPRLDSNSAARLAQHFTRLVGGLVRGPGTPLSNVPMLGAEERRDLIWRARGKRTDYPRTTVSTLFAEMVARRPDGPAIREGSVRLTYRELRDRASSLAGALRASGLDASRPVAICMERSIDFVTTVLAALDLGASYVPIDPEDPPVRQLRVVETSRASMILTHRQCAPANSPIPVVRVDREPMNSELDSPMNSRNRTDARPKSGPADPFSILFTSGSTGEPKGVAITHENLISLVRGSDRLPFRECPVFAFTSSPAFDASALEVWGTLLNGQELAVLPHEHLDLVKLEDFLDTCEVAGIWLTSSLLSLIVDRSPQILRRLSHVLFGGEPHSIDHLRRALLALPGTRFTHGYGPTETTIFATTYRLPPSLPESIDSVPIGAPLENRSAIIVDRWGDPVPQGVVGEIAIGGAGVGRALSPADSAAFTQTPADPGGPGYRSGDLGWLRADGNIVLVGREDEQIKIRGHRIELGEVEAAAMALPAIDRCVARADADSIVAYMVPAPRCAPSEDSIRAQLAERLPIFMLPARIVFLDEIPRQKSGKVDRAALKRWQPDRDTTRAPARGPRNELESTLLLVWRSVLEQSTIGVESNFFDHGGHSLRALELVDRLGRVTGVEIPVAAVFQAPTVLRMAALLHERHLRLILPPVVSLKNGPSSRPLFWIFNSDPIPTLLSQIPPAHSLYWVKSPLDDGRPIPPNSVCEAAAESIRNIRDVCHTDPLVLGGYSFGGLVAYEMACQLEAEGFPPDQLFLVEPVLHAGGWRALKELLRVRWWRRQAMRNRCEKMIRRGERLPAGQLPRFINLRHRDAAVKYRPRPYSGRVVLYHRESHEEQRSEWVRLIGDGIEFVPLPARRHGELADRAGSELWIHQMFEAIDARAISVTRG